MSENDAKRMKDAGALRLEAEEAARKAEAPVEVEEPEMEEPEVEKEPEADPEKDPEEDPEKEPE